MIRSILTVSHIAAYMKRDIRRVRSQIDEKSTVGNSSTLFKVLLEESGSFHVNTHSGKDDGEIVFVSIVHTLGSSWSADQTGLSTNLGSNVVVR
jgi:hypothetical protein